ncbi:MAG: DNA-directed RNA polymerase subunit beta [Bryobacterales bacterium]|nr:DNA-directed RNA polymerase subunit beta [Bryobacterales bacterium]MDE0627539.1 DNA-directed RNA polymerase subunit beta [Bryobacterales bacterium]
MNESIEPSSNGSAAAAAMSARHDFSAIKTAIPIPNLIEVQRESYERFLQMDLLPGEREETGLQAVFKSVFPISDFREMSSLDFVSYSIGDWECKCGTLAGLHHLRTRCEQCHASIRSDSKGPPLLLCGECGALTPNNVTFCQRCGDPVELKLKYGVNECQERGMTYSAPLKVTIKLTVFEKARGPRGKAIRDIKEQEVFFGEIPLMTENGTFVISGTERVIVSQLHRSPGVFFESSNDRTYFLGKIIPYRGSWVEFEYDHKNLLQVRIDRKRKFLGTIFLRALGLRDDSQILRKFYKVDPIRLAESGGFERQVSENLLGTRLASNIAAPQDSTLQAGGPRGGGLPVGGPGPRRPARRTRRRGRLLGRKGRKVNPRLLQQLKEAGIEWLPCSEEDLFEAVFADDLVNEDSGEVLAGCESNAPVTEKALEQIATAGIAEFEVIFPESDECGVVLSQTLRKDTVKTQDEALLEIYRKLRPGDPPTKETAWELFNGMFFDSRKYDFSRVGRMKFNIKLHGEAEATPLERRVLDETDFFKTIDYLFRLRRNIGSTDDIDHLGNRRVRAVGELLENQFRIGLIRMERAMKERMTVYQDMTSAMPHDLINAKPVMAAVREFFGSSQLSQFMDQINPLSEITHKRRLSALGPGGLSRERAGFDVRDVHTTHYGRICPIETPEGPNIGLISSLSCFARINEYGFIESPYRKVENGYVIDQVRITYAGDTEFKPGDVVRRAEAEQANAGLPAGGSEAHWVAHCPYLSAWEEDKYVIAQANIPVAENGFIDREFANCRVAGDFQLKRRAEIQYLDVSPKQLVSVAASLIPFLENDDANRALMGSNMQRQAVPLLRADSPIVGTGMERITARDSGAVVLCKRSGIVDSVDSERIIVRVEDTGHEEQLSREVGADIYQLVKFRRSNQNTCINQKPIVTVGDYVEKGQVLADGPCTDDGELALGRNVLVAFMPWRGYNFEDAILVSEKLVKDDFYTSLHIEEFEVEARETKLGPEEITRDIPNISESFLQDLDESGVVRIGAKVTPDDILVGKVVPKGDVQLTPEEKLLRAIFGDKAGEVKDQSLRCPPGVSGTVVGAKVFLRKGVDKDSRALAIEEEETNRLERNLEDEMRILLDQRAERLEALFEGYVALADLHDQKTNRRLASAGDVLNRDRVYTIRARDLKRLRLGAAPDPAGDQEDAGPPPESVPDFSGHVDSIEQMTIRQIEILKKLTKERIAKLRKGDELPPGVIKVVKVYIAMKRKLSAGDKMAGRHGNKGVIARVLPEEDMPFLPDGTPVEIVLNPLGVPSRMNVGQILETHLGWAGLKLGRKFAVPVFEGQGERLIKSSLHEAGLPESGKTALYDGATGQPFEQEVTVGVIYMLKLSHLVDDKIHARSIGPYSLITQQPLGGKAQFGGQRFGEMEVWALEAYGAAHILQELLTVKSDDVQGRAKIYESIVKGESAMKPGVPESFNVLVRELQALCLDVELVQSQQDMIETALAAD